MNGFNILTTKYMYSSSYYCST